MTRKLLFLNRRSGKLQTAGLDVEMFDADLTTVEVSRATDFTQAIKRAVEDGCETVIAGGGDGTVNAVVNGLMHVEASHRPRLGILPLGTANDFAGTLGIPDDLAEAARLIGSPRCVPIDVVHITASGFERYFANVAAGGNSVRVTEEMTDELKARWGAFCYLRGAIEVLADLKTFEITAQCDEERIEELASWAVLVANGKTNAGRIMVAPAASVTDGLIDVIIIRNGSSLDIAQIIANSVLGKFLDCEQVIHRQVKRLHLHSEPGMKFTLDGELIDEEPVEFTVVEQAISTFVGDPT